MNTIGKVVQRADRREGQSNNGNPWIKETLVIETQDDKPKKMAMEFFGEDRVKWLDALKAGDLVSVKWSPEATEFDGRWFTTLKAFGLTKLEKQQV